MFDYPIVLTPDDDGSVIATFVDLPGATYGKDDLDACARAVDALESILQGMMDDRLDIPAASESIDRPTVRPTLLSRLKLHAYMAMREKGWRKADLARALGVAPRQVDRLLDLRHLSTVPQIEAAIAACGRRADVILEAA